MGAEKVISELCLLPVTFSHILEKVPSKGFSLQDIVIVVIVTHLLFYTLTAANISYTPTETSCGSDVSDPVQFYAKV